MSKRLGHKSAGHKTIVHTGVPIPIPFLLSTPVVLFCVSAWAILTSALSVLYGHHVQQVGSSANPV